MFATFRRLIVLACWLTGGIVSGAYGQTGAAPELNLTLGEQRVKFAPTRSFQEMRLEVVNSVGEIVFTHTTNDAEFDWILRAGNGEPLAAGLYSYVLTLKLSEEQTSQHRGNLIIEQGQQQVWLTTQDGATVSGSSLNAARSGGRSVAGFRAVEEKGNQRAIEGRELEAEKSGNLNNFTKAVRQEKAALLGTANLVAKFDVGGVNLIDSAIIETGGNVGIGTLSPNAKLSVSANTVAPPSEVGIVGYFANANANNTFITADSFGIGFHSDFLFRHARGTMAVPLALQTDDIIGQIQARGYGATGFATTARAGIRMTAAENWTNMAQGAYLAFMTNPSGSAAINVERMRITDAGNVGIGTTTPGEKLHVEGSGNTSILSESTGGFATVDIDATSGDAALRFKKNGALRWNIRNNPANDNLQFFETGASERMRIENGTGKVVISGTLQLPNLEPSGGTQNICVNGSNVIVDCGISSLRYKTNVTPFKTGLAEINRLRPVNFTWKTTGENDFGLIAEEVAATAPVLSLYEKDGTVKGVNYGKLGVVLINAVKEQQAMITQQQKTMAQQQRMMARMQKRLLKLEKTRKPAAR